MTPTDGLLVDEVRVFDRGEPGVVAVTKDTTQLGSRRGRAAGHDQCRAAKIDEADLATFLDPQRRRSSAGTLVWPRCDTLALLVAGIAAL